MLLRWLAACPLLAVSLFAQKKTITIETLTERPRGNGFSGEIVWAPDGKHFAFKQNNRVMLYDVRAKSEKELLSLDALEQSATPAQEPESLDWQNRHVEEESLQWLPSGQELLVSAGGDLFLFRLESSDWRQLAATPEPERDPKLSPDGTHVAFRRDHDLYDMEIASGQVTRLTGNGSATLLNGELDWVYPEELELSTAYWWSPDSKHIAYMQLDTAREFVYPQVSLTGPRATLESQRYPQAGTPNAVVRVGVVPASGGDTRWLDLGDDPEALIARIYWEPDSSKLAIERLNRIQNQLDLLLANTETGVSQLILHETDPYWINVNDLFRFLADGEFIWGSERDGHQHLYLYTADGKECRRITEGRWEVTDVAGIDEARQKLYFVSTEASPLERQLYSVKLNGKERTRISRGAGTHTISMGPDSDYYLDKFSSLTQPTRRLIYKSDGAEWTVFREADRQLTEEYDFLPAKIVDVKASDGTLLYGRLTKPANFRSGQKYPAVVMVYGGPGVQQVTNSWSGATWEQVLAQRGFVIWELDNRGSSGRGHAFETPIFRRFGRAELADQLDGIRYLIAQGFVDPARIGIYGWSYGGYMTLYSLLNAPGTFKAGIAGAPVANWRNYDTIYTERYLGLPSENPEGYQASSTADLAGKLQAKLLILHNIEDDNVLFQNTVQMSEAFERAGKLFDLVIYPQKTHDVRSPFRKQLLEKTTDFFEKNLK